MKVFASWLVALGVAVAAIGSQACWIVIVDEPECPESLIK